MKSIEEAAKEYALLAGMAIETDIDDNGEFDHESFIDDSFKAGIEFAERWIPVGEELPPCSDEDLLIKGLDLEGNDGIVDIGYMHDSPDGIPSVDNFISLGGVLIKITHWRPINHK